MTRQLPRDLAWLLAAGDRLISSTGWIGQHPASGKDVAHLLIHPLGDGQAAQMRAVATELHVPPVAAAAGGMPDVDAGTSLRIARGTATVVRNGTDVLSRPVTEQWSTVTLDARWVILTIGQDGLVAGTGDRLEKYLRRAARLYMGRIAAAEPGQTPQTTAATDRRARPDRIRSEDTMTTHTTELTFTRTGVQTATVTGLYDLVTTYVDLAIEEGYGVDRERAVALALADVISHILTEVDDDRADYRVNADPLTADLQVELVDDGQPGTLERNFERLQEHIQNMPLIPSICYIARKTLKASS